nr:heavy metal translocating P-type ATPase [Treponema sp.]
MSEKEEIIESTEHECHCHDQDCHEEGHHHKENHLGDHIHCDCGCHDHHHNHHHDHEEGHHHHDGLHCSCGCHEEGSEEESPLKKILLSALLFVAALLVQHLPVFSAESPIMTSLAKSFTFINDLPRLIYGILYLAAYLVCGRDVVKGAIRNIHKGNLFGEQFLMTIASVGAIFVGEYAEAVAVMLFYNLGEFVQDYAVDRSRDSISALMDIRPDKASVIRDGKVSVVSPEDVQIGEVIEVKAGERLPLDGIVIEGKSYADTSALTGESLPREVGPESQVLAGFVNQTSLLKIKVTKSYGDSAVTRILNLTEK